MFWNKTKLTIGQLGEKEAKKYLKKNGYKIIQSNFQNNIGKRVGEIDIIAKKKDAIVFVEVKTRKIKKQNNILPEENINYQKLQKLQKIAQIYIKINNLWDFPYHFDAISVWVDENQKVLRIKHLKNIFL